MEGQEDTIFPDIVPPSSWEDVLVTPLTSGEWQPLDYVFVVGDEKRRFPINSLLLESLSVPFSEHVRCTGVARTWVRPQTRPKVFEQFLNYVHFRPVDEGALTGDEVLKLMDLAQEFEITPLFHKCSAMMVSMLTIDNAIQIYGIATMRKLRDLESATVSFLRRNVKEIAESRALLEADEGFLIFFIQDLNVDCEDEVILFQGVHRWGLHQLWKHPDKQIRVVLQNIIHLVRFTLLTPQQLADVVAPTGILSAAELSNVFTYVCGTNPSRVRPPFNMAPRRSRGRDMSTSLNPAPACGNGKRTKTSEQYQEHPISVEAATQTLYENNSTMTLETDSGILDNFSPTPSPQLDTDWPLPSSPTETMQCSPQVSQGSTDKSDNVTAEPHDVPTNEERPSPVYKRREMPPPPPPRAMSVTSSMFSPAGSAITRVVSSTRPAYLRGTDPDSDEGSEHSGEPDSDEDCMLLSYSKKLKVEAWEDYVDRWNTSSNSATVAGIKLEQCLIRRQYKRPILPKLEELSLDLIIPVNKMDEPNPYNRFMSVLDIRKYVFFQKKRERDWKFDELWTMKVLIDIVINGVTVLKMSRKEKEVTINLINDSTEVMGSLIRVSSKQFEKLNLVFTDLPPNGFLCDPIKELCLHRCVDEFESGLGSFLKKLKNLESLVCWMDRNKYDTTTPRGNQDISPVDLAHHLISGEKLRRCAISRAKILYNTSTFLNGKKEGLEELYTNLCHWSPSVFEHFHELFPNLQRVAFKADVKFKFDNREMMGTAIKNAEPLQSWATPTLLLNLLKIRQIQWIRIWGMDWNPKENNNSGKRLSLSKLRGSSGITNEELSKLIIFVTEAGLPKNANNFLLEKNDSTNKWTASCYDGQEDDDNYLEDMKALDFDYYQLHKVYKDIDTWEKYGPDYTMNENR